MLNSASSVAPKPTTLPSMAPTGSPSAGTAGGQSFAQLLSEQPDLQPQARSAPTPSAPSPSGDSQASAHEASAAPPPPASATQAKRKEANAAAPKPATPAQPPAASASNSKSPDAAKAGDDDTQVAEDSTEGTELAGTAGLNEFTQLIGLAAPPAQALTAASCAAAATEAGVADAADGPGRPGAHAARTGGVTPDTDATGTSADGTETGTATGAALATERRPAETPGRASDAPRGKGIELAADKAATARSALRDIGEVQQGASAAPGEASPRAAGTADAATPNFAAMLAQAFPTTTGSADATPASASGRVHAALNSNGFAPELAANVSLLAVDGTQQAELQLNPTDMGPVTVQIIVDGTQAQVSFHAVQAETRQALEQSMPDLAAALQGQGLTLSGGGVFQQFSREPKNGDGEPGNANENGGRVGADRARVSGSSIAPATVARRAVGLLDTFA